MTTKFSRMFAFGVILGSAALISCKGEPTPASESDADEAWHNEDFASTTQGLYKGRPGAVNGDYNYCDGALLCDGGEGDCDSNTECSAGVVCGKDNGAAFGMPKTWDVCVAPHCVNHAQDADETGADCGGADCGTCNGGASCTGTNGDLDFCLAGCQCGQGQGDCDYDSDCQAGLVCKRKIGASFGLAADTDVCVAAHCRNAKKDADETGKDCGGADCQACAVANACSTSPLWMPVDCTTPSWVWSSDRVNAATLSAANAAHKLYVGDQHLSVPNTCSLDGTGWVSTQVFTMAGCDATWWHIGGSFTGACGGHDGDQIRRLALGPNDCYDYTGLPL